MESTGKIRIIFFIMGLFSVFKYLMEVLTGERRKLYGRHVSLVRQIGSLLPMKSPPWFCLGSRLNHYNVGTGNVCSQGCFLEEDPSYIRSYCGSCHLSQLISSFYCTNIRSSTPIKGMKKRSWLWSRKYRHCDSWLMSCGCVIKQPSHLTVKRCWWL